MGIKIYSDLKTDKVVFSGSRVNDQEIGSVVATVHPTQSERIVIKSNTIFKRNSDSEFRTFFKRLKFNRVENSAGEQLSAAPYNLDRDGVVDYLNAEFTKAVVNTHFKYNSATDRLVATKDIEVAKNGFFLGSKHKMASGSSNIYFEDLDNNANSYPVFGEVLDQSLPANQAPGAGVSPPKSRIFQDFSSIPLGGLPVNDTAIGYDGDNFFPFNISGVGITCRIAEVVPPSQQLKYAIVVNGIEVYVQYLEHSGLAINEDLTWYFDQPLDIEAGTTLRASIYKVSVVDNEEVVGGILQVCEGDADPLRYQTNVLHRLFTDEPIALKSDLDALLTGSTYKGSYDADADSPSLPTGTDTLGDFYRVTVPGNGKNVGDILVFNGTSYDHVAENQATQTDIKTSSLKVHDIYVKAGYVGAVKDGSILYPYADIQTAINTANDGDSIFLDGSFEITSEITLPDDKSLYFYGSDETIIKYATYDSTNGNLVHQSSASCTQTYSFNNIQFANAGEYGLHVKSAAEVKLENCELFNNGWGQTALHTILDSSASGLLGYDSDTASLQAFYAGTAASNGGAMRIELVTKLFLVGNSVHHNLRGMRVQDCGVNGAGVITRNQVYENIESGIYLAAGGVYSGCQNITVSMNLSAYNANNGLLMIGGINNKFSQNEVKGNWNAGACFWGSANATLRDCGLYDNNRSAYNGIGNPGDAKASIQINEAYDLFGTAITMDSAARFIAEILDTQVHYTGLGSNTEKLGFLISSDVGGLVDNPKNIIKVDDVGFIGQDYAIDLSEVDISNLRLSFGDNSYQSMGFGAVKAPLAGNYAELPFSNHVMEVPSVDVVVDTLKQTVALHEGVGGNVINTYHINELQADVVNGKVDILQRSSDKIQLRGLSFGNVYINGVVAGNDINSANDSLNAAFNMDLVNYKSFLVSEVGVNGDASSGGSLPAIANNWYISYGSQAGTQIPTATIGNNYRAYNPFYNGEALEKGHEFIWTLNPTISFMIGLWGAAETAQAGSAALSASNWAQGFYYHGTTTGGNNFRQGSSSGVTLEENSAIAGYYNVTNGQLALRFGVDGYLYLFEVVSGGYTLIGKSNSTIAGSSVMIQWASFNEGSFPVMTERTETWEVVADEDDNLGGEWSGGIEESTVLRSRMSFSPGEKITLNLSYFGRHETIGFGYTGTPIGQSSAENLVTTRLFYNTSEILKSATDDGIDWTWNTSAANSYNPNGDGTDVGYGQSSVNLGLISFRYMNDNTVELWHETDNVLMATKVVPFDGSAQHIYLGANENDHDASRIPVLVKYDMSAEDSGATLTGWWYVESPDGEFFYPLFASEAEANYIDSVEGGGGTSHTHTFDDDTYNSGGNTWYMPSTSGVHSGTSAPQGGVFGNSINVVWNEIPTGDDSNYLPTFNNITYNVQEGSAINIQYKAAGMTDTFNLTNVPAGYADNGFAIIGTAENITNGYGQAVQHVINVTKANNFGSVQGTITINVLANLAGNEFTLVDQGGAIKFTQDGGVSVLDFNTVTFNAGSTYKFYLDGTTLQTNDIVNIVDENGNGILGNDGLTQMGAGAGYSGAHFQYAIPSDVSPGKKITFTDGATSTSYADVPLTIAGSTYSVDVTGIDLEGPSANQTGTNAMDAGEHGWISLDEPLGAGERLVLDNAFFADLFGEARGNQTAFAIGLKGDNWVNTREVSSNGAAAGGGTAGNETFKGNLYIVGIWNSSASTVTMWIGSNNQLSSYMSMSSQSTWETACAFLEVTGSGNNIRAAMGRNGSSGVSQGDESTVTYGNWNSYKGQTGEQGYGISSLDVVMSFWTTSGGAAIDGDEIDWTGLTEVSIPTPPASSMTTFSKALDFSGSNERAVMANNSTGVMPLSTTAGTVTAQHANGSGTTSNSSYANPWAVACVFRQDGNQSVQHIWNQGEGAGSTDDNVYLRLKPTGPDTSTVVFGWGRSGAINEVELLNIGGSYNLSVGSWWGVYVGFNGTRLSGSNATAANLADCFDFKMVATNDLPQMGNLHPLTTNTTSRPWSATGGRMDRPITGEFNVGGRGGNRNFHGSVASCVVTTLKCGVAMPTDAEAYDMLTDPIKWITDYKVGNTFRQPPNTGVSYNFQVGSATASYGTQVWLMGDGTNDSYSNMIRNQVIPSDQNYTKLNMISMASNDIVNVTIPGLS